MKGKLTETCSQCNSTFLYSEIIWKFIQFIGNESYCPKCNKHTKGTFI